MYKSTYLFRIKDPKQSKIYISYKCTNQHIKIISFHLELKIPNSKIYTYHTPLYHKTLNCIPYYIC